MLIRVAFTLVVLLLFLVSPTYAAEPSLCHAFVDYDFIWTLEVVRQRAAVTPILNVVAFSSGEWEVQPAQIKITDEKGAERKVEDFSFDSGDPAKPYLNPYFKLRGGEFIGMDLIGDFSTVDAFSRVEIETGKDRFILEPMDCNSFEELADKIGELEIGTGNQVAAFQMLNIQLLGERGEP